MPQANFGVADVIIIPPAAATDQTRIRLATLQDVSLEIDNSIELLYGDKGVAIEAAISQRKYSGKASFGKLDAAILALGHDGAVVTTGSNLRVEETGTVTAGAVTVAGSAQYVEDFGVYAADGSKYSRVAASPTGLQYTVAAGVYSFNVSENTKALTFRYAKTQTAGKTIAQGNPSMGVATKYKLDCYNSFSANGSQTLAAELFAVVIPKLSMPFKNTGFTIPSLDFTALDDGSGNTIKWYVQS